MAYCGVNPPEYDMVRAHAQLETQPVTAADLDDGVWYLVARGIGLKFAFGKAERKPDGSYILHCITVDGQNRFDMRADEFPIGIMMDGARSKGVFKYPAPAPNLVPDPAPVVAVGGKRSAFKRRITRRRRKAQRRTYRR